MSKTYKQADKHVLFWVVYSSFVILVLLVLLWNQWQVGVLDVVLIEAVVTDAAGWLMAMKTMLQITRMALEEEKMEHKYESLAMIATLWGPLWTQLCSELMPTTAC